MRATADSVSLNFGRPGGKPSLGSLLVPDSGSLLLSGCQSLQSRSGLDVACHQGHKESIMGYLESLLCMLELYASYEWRTYDDIVCIFCNFGIALPASYVSVVCPLLEFASICLGQPQGPDPSVCVRNQRGGGKHS